MSEIISKVAITELLRSFVPDCEWLLRRIESEQGWLCFPPALSTVIKNLKLENYPLLYENENAIGSALPRGLFSDAEINELNTELELASPEQSGEFLLDFTTGFDEGLKQVEFPTTPEQVEKQKELFDAMHSEEKAAAIRGAQYLLIAFLASFYQTLSMMVHGEKLTSLVTQAKAGNDDAFVKAIQIDKRILNTVPYFSERYSRAQDQGDSNFSIVYLIGLELRPT